MEHVLRGSTQEHTRDALNSGMLSFRSVRHILVGKHFECSGSHIYECEQADKITVSVCNVIRQFDCRATLMCHMMMCPLLQLDGKVLSYTSTFHVDMMMTDVAIISQKHSTVHNE